MGVPHSRVFGTFERVSLLLLLLLPPAWRWGLTERWLAVKSTNWFLLQSACLPACQHVAFRFTNIAGCVYTSLWVSKPQHGPRACRLWTRSWKTRESSIFLLLGPNPWNGGGTKTYLALSRFLPFSFSFSFSFFLLIHLATWETQQEICASHGAARKCVGFSSA